MCKKTEKVQRPAGELGLVCKKTEKVQRPAGELGLVCKKTEKEFKKEGHERKKTCITCYNLYTHI